MVVYVLLVDMGLSIKMWEIFLKCRDLVIDGFSVIFGFKVNCLEGVFYLFLDISFYFGKLDGIIIVNIVDDFCDYILWIVYVVIVIGSVFGVDNCFRLFYVVLEE